jgi:hypothetical protein
MAMMTVTADNAMLSKLRQATEFAEIRDGDGNVVGFFLPPEDDESSSGGDAAPLDWEELDRRTRSTEKGFTTKEVFEHLLTLTQDEATRADLQRKIDRLAKEEGCDTP